jgi:hypothetical protein
VISVLYLWKISLLSLPYAIFRIAVDRIPLRNDPNISFFKLVGCGKGNTFTPLDADPRRWGLVLCFDSGYLKEFDESKLVKRWRSKCKGEFRVILNPISSHGTWSHREPFSFRNDDKSESNKGNGQVAAITRARISFSKYPRFLRAVPSVARALHESPGVMCAIGIGEAPVGLQGTFSIWESAEALREFTYKSHPHADAISASQQFDWYTEELFARFSVRETRGLL